MKIRSRRTARWFGAATVAFAALAQFDASAEILEQVLVKVNGDILTKTELEAKQVSALRSRINSAVDADAMKNDDTLKKMIAEVTPRILVDTIDEMLLLQLGKEKGYTVTDQQFREWMADIRKTQNLEDDQKFKAALASEGMTLDDLRRNFERQVTVYRVQQDEVGQKLQITEEEARQYYLAHQSEFVEEATVTVREIAVEIPASTQGGEAGVNVGQDDAAQKKVEAIRGRVMAGEDFGKVAAEVSSSPSKANGGLIGPLPMKELSPALQDLLSKMKPGDVSQPVRSAKSFQIFKLEKMTTPVTQPFESVRDVVAEKVYGSRQQNEVKKFLGRLRNQALIVWKNEELKKAYEGFVKAQEASSGGE
jgi:peptidyl-prolyl cis-trans isomerase SurA